MNILAGLQKGGAVLNALGGLIPVMGALVASAEELFPTAGAGAQKLEYVTGIIKNALTFSGAAIADIESMSGSIITVINNIVAAAKAPAVAPVAPTPAPVAAQ